MNMAKAGKGGRKGAKAAPEKPSEAAARVPPEEIQCVFGYWRWVPADPSVLGQPPWQTGRWELAESWPGDGDGMALRSPSTGGRDRQEWSLWLGEKGRAVTMWTVSSGVTLMGVRPDQPRGMLSQRFWDRLPDLPDWHEHLEDGFRLVAGTVNAACREMGWPEHYTGG
jgi:hypothetical protein